MNRMKVVASGAFALALIFGFQNCSGVKFGPAESPAVAKSAAGPGEAIDGDVEMDDAPADVAAPDEIKSDKSPVEYRLLCSAKRSFAVDAPANGTIENLSGNFAFKISTIKLISGMRGNLVLLSKSNAEKGKIETLTNQAGNFLLCDSDIADIKGFTRGNVIIVNGNVGNIDGFHGNLLVIGGAITGSVTNSKGNIRSL